MTPDILRSLIKSDPAKAALVGAAAGGCFAFFNTIVSKGLDACASRIGRSRQVRGLVIASVLEVALNIDAMLGLAALLKFTAAQLETEEETTSGAQAYMQHHLRHMCLSTAMWERLAACEGTSEHGTLALMLVPGRYDAARALFIKTESLCETGGGLVPTTLNGLSEEVRDELRASAHAAVLLLASLAGSKVASGAWVLLVPRLARLHRRGIPALTKADRSAGVRELQKSVRHVAKLDQESAAIYHDAMLFLGVTDRS